MSFTVTVKNELVSTDRLKTEIISELSAILRNNAEISNIIKINTENALLAKFIYKSIKELYNLNIKITVRKGYNFNKNYIYILEIKKEIDKLIKELSFDNEIPSSFLYADDDLARAYLRGAFLSCGSINDPKTSRYHLELVMDEEKYAEFINERIMKYRLNSKLIKRDSKYMVYIKEAEKISDFLKLIGANNAVMYYENIRIYRDKKNMTNRLNNCEQANVDKVIGTCDKQIKAIKALMETDTFDLLDEKLKEVSEYRLKYPETSLLELAEIISIETENKITKSGLHHRFKKIEKQAEKVRSTL
jgi:conserved hypothetical protein